MSKSTEDETVRLLKETFADREHLVDAGLPEATKGSLLKASNVRGSHSGRRPQPTGRRTWPVLLAAASVLAVAGGGVYAARDGDRTGVAPPAETPTTARVPSTIPTTGQPTVPSIGETAQVPHGPVDPNAPVWAEVIKAAGAIEAPAGGWPVLIAIDAPQPGLSGSGPGSSGGQQRGKPFSAATRAAIEKLLAPTPVQWVSRSPAVEHEDVCKFTPAGPVITVSPVVSKGGHLEVGMSAWRGCLSANWKTYRLDRQGGGWRVTGTVGPEAIA